MLGTIIAYIIIGLLAGLIARAILPGRQSMGLVATTLLGIAGALVGGFIGSFLFGRGTSGDVFSIWGLLLSVGGAVLVLFLFGLVTGRRGGGGRRVTA